ncbi:MAG: hypothetical protein QM689_09345 [Oscillospiraceae bacterium]
MTFRQYQKACKLTTGVLELRWFVALVAINALTGVVFGRDGSGVSVDFSLTVFVLAFFIGVVGIAVRRVKSPCVIGMLPADNTRIVRYDYLLLLRTLLIAVGVMLFIYGAAGAAYCIGSGTSFTEAKEEITRGFSDIYAHGSFLYRFLLWSIVLAGLIPLAYLRRLKTWLYGFAADLLLVFLISQAAANLGFQKSGLYFMVNVPEAVSGYPHAGILFGVMLGILVAVIAVGAVLSVRFAQRRGS